MSRKKTVGAGAKNAHYPAGTEVWPSLAFQNVVLEKTKGSPWGL